MPFPERLERRALLLGGLFALTAAAIGASASPAPGAGVKDEAKDLILFVSDRQKPNEHAIFTMNADGSGQTRLSKGDGIIFDPAWSPDHSQVLFSRLSDPAKRAASLCVMKSDGSGVVELSPGEENTLAVAPAWSPDGKHIAYSLVHIADGKPDSAVYIMDPDGKNRRKFMEGIVPVWSPDSKRILFSTLPASGPPELKVADLDGTNVKTLAATGLGPAWSPDGKRIAFASENENRPAIFIMDADGSHTALLTRQADIAAIGPIWTADGKHILFTRMPKEPSAKPPMEIWTMDPDGGNAKALTKAGSFAGPGTSVFYIMMTMGK